MIDIQLLPRRPRRLASAWLLGSLLTIAGVRPDRALADNPPAPDNPGGGAPARLELPSRPAWKDSKFVGTPDPPPPYTVEPAFPHLTFKNPLVISRAPGSPRLFVGELQGKLWSFPEDPSCKSADLVVDLAKVHPDLSALYGLAFHPQFEKNRQVFICYVLKNEDPNGSVVSRFEMSRTDPPTLDPKTEKVLLTFLSGGHNGACLDFGNDGHLYISTGDAGPASPPDPLRTGQDCSDLLSSILRIDVDNPEPGKPYRVPADNPFVSTPGVRPEIWAFGFRNPWKMSFDPPTGDLWVGDVGWELWEMVDKVGKGDNFGWSVTEGPQPVHVNGRLGPSPIVPPIMVHPHSEAASITGGYVYRGKRLPALQGTYVYGDFQSGIVWGLRSSGKVATSVQELARTPLHLVAFGRSNGEELYLLDYDASQQLYRLVPNPEAGRNTAFPRKLSETGLFSSARELRPAEGLVPYSVNSEMWADGATAERYLAVPGTGRVDRDSSGIWKFPEGSVLVRTVLLGGGPEAPARRVETQVLHLEKGAWMPYTYAWQDDQADATLVGAKGTDITLRLPDPSSPGRAVERPYHVAARNECILCHNPWVEKKTTIYGPQSASPLGVNTAQLNRDVERGGKRVNQLAALHAIGLLAWTPEPEKLPRLADPYDASAELDRRARSYLQTNCAHCHQFNAGGSATIALGFEVPRDEMRAVGVKPIQGTFSIDDARIIAPGEPERSVLFYRICKMGGGRMPRAGSAEVDVRATRLIHDWIRGLPREAKDRDRPREGASAERALAATLLDKPGGAGSAQSEAVRRLVASTSGALLLLDLIDREGLPSALRDEALRLARTSPLIEVRDLFERFIPPAERIKRLGETVDRRALLAMKGDRGRGRDVFLNSPAAQCKTCHKAEGAGQDVGPDLSKIGAKYDRPTMLDHVLEPSRTIDPQYLTHLVETKEGRVHTGILAEKTDEALVLKDAQGTVVRIPRAEVEVTAPQARSLMPELLLRDLTPQQAADLLEYLVSLR